MSKDANLELEKFREQWREEVIARSKGASTAYSIKAKQPVSTTPATTIAPDKRPLIPNPDASIARGNEDEDSSGHAYHDLEDQDEASRLGESGKGSHPSNHTKQEPQSALEHYEKAVERESQGNLGDSLSLYRKAYRLDSHVDKVYRNKHFPPSTSSSKPIEPNPSAAPVTVPNPAHHSIHGTPAAPSSTTSQLLTSFSTLSIEPVAPPTSASSSPPCPISTLPTELLSEILLLTALADIASFSRLSLVCKRLAYLISAEDAIWKHICLGSKFGFAGMHYSFACPLPSTSNNLPILLSATAATIIPTPLSALTLPLSPTYPTYATMFHSRPRLRFSGVYISTVNYTRPGASSPTNTSWNSPIHIVTYYRYLRFFRDGTCASLLTTSEPSDVVPYMTKEHLHAHHGASSALPSAVMRDARRGRWKLSGRPALVDAPETEFETGNAHESSGGANAANRGRKLRNSDEEEGNLSIETEGPSSDGKYVYCMQLALRSGGPRKGPGTRNNKLVWRAFWSWNRLTDDWAEFGLRNDRAFWWSRVRGFGLGE